MGEANWERARLFPVSGIGGSDEQERRGASALLAVLDAVREFGRAITVPLGAPAGRLSAFIEVPFTLGDRHLRPDGLIEVVLGQKTWTALVEVKTGREVLKAAQLESYLELARAQKFDALLTISNQLVTTPGEHPVHIPRSKTLSVSLHHLSWSQIRTEALLAQANKSVSDPDQAWILAEFIRYLEHPRSGSVDFDDMGPSWVKVRDGARAGTLHSRDEGVTEVADRFGHLVSFAAMQLTRELGVEVSAGPAHVRLRDPAGHQQGAVADLVATGQLHGALRVPGTVAPIKVTADLRASLVHCAVTVPAPREGKPTTRVNWLVRQLKDAPGHLCIEATALRQRGSGPVRTLAEARNDPRVLIADPAHELRAFTLSLPANAGGARGQNHGSFVKSVVGAVEKFYAEVVQHIKPWAPTPPRARDDEATPPDGLTGQDGPAITPRLPSGQADQGHPVAGLSPAVNGTALVWSGTEHDYMVPNCGGRIGLFGGAVSHDGAG
jgi:hypothetical protein